MTVTGSELVPRAICYGWCNSIESQHCFTLIERCFGVISTSVFRSVAPSELIEQAD